MASHACCQAWAVLYLAINLLTTSWALHFIAIGLLLCLVSYLRLPPPSPVLAAEILGPPPNSSDDTEVGVLPKQFADGECFHNLNLKVCWEVAHRAACLDAPENSLEAVRSVKNYLQNMTLDLAVNIRLAAANGAKWVEFDVSFTSDGTAVAFHDDTVDRITDGEGAVTSLTFSQVSCIGNYLFEICSNQ